MWFFSPLYLEKVESFLVSICANMEMDDWLFIWTPEEDLRGPGKEKDLINESTGRSGLPRVAGKFWMEGSDDTLE